VVGYYADPPVTEIGQVKWLNLLGYRQGGKSLTAEACGYVKPPTRRASTTSVSLTTKSRAEYLHRRVHLIHQNWPEGRAGFHGAQPRGPPALVPARRQDAYLVG
jgi:hypothetical protein